MHGSPLTDHRLRLCGGDHANVQTQRHTHMQDSVILGQFLGSGAHTCMAYAFERV